MRDKPKKMSVVEIMESAKAHVYVFESYVGLSKLTDSACIQTARANRTDRQSELVRDLLKSSVMVIVFRT